jgi:hypothetical protein
VRGLRITLFVIAFVILASQAFRHAYVRWMEPRTSVLDKYNGETEQQIMSAKSLPELLSLYDAAHSRLKDYEKSHPEEAGKREYQRTGEYARLSSDQTSVRNAIQEWERKSKDLHELWYFWLFGIFAFLLGSFVTLRSDRWVGIALLILAFSEMVWATSPSLRSFGAQPEFDRLLVHKLVLTVASLLLLLLTWLWARRAEEK